MWYMHWISFLKDSNLIVLMMVERFINSFKRVGCTAVGFLFSVQVDVRAIFKHRIL